MTRRRQFLIAYALVLFFCGAPVRGQVVVDNDDGSPAYVETGPWSTSGSTGYNGGTYRFSSVGNSSTAKWTATLPTTKSYEIFIWYVPGSNRASSTKYDIHASDGVHTVFVDQKSGGLTWDSLGSFPFNAGSNFILLDVAGSSGGNVVIADAVRFGADSGPPIDPPEPEEVAPGVFHSVWELPITQVNHVLEFDLADPQYTIEMGFAQGKRKYTAKQPVSTIVTYYDSPGHEVVAAVNASFFGSGIDILGMLGSGGNVISTHPGVPGLEMSYMLQQSGEGWAGFAIPTANMTVTFADAAQVQIDDLDYTCSAGNVMLYTPDWGPSTQSTAQGVEIIVGDVNLPLRPNKDLVGTISAVRTGAQSLNNAIPADGFVLSACSGAESELLPHAVVGQQVTVRFSMTPADMVNLQTLVTGNVWIVKDGAAYHAGDAARHPRTVIAWSGTKHWLVTFDGRQPGYAVGASTAEQADFLINALGVENAVNLDGGGSTTMVIDGDVVNCPSDNATTPCTGVERADPNAMLLIRRTTPTSFPLADAFSAAEATGGRALPWDDKFTLNPVVAFEPGARGGPLDGYAMHVFNPAGEWESASVGQAIDRHYAVSAYVYCDYRPELAADGYERVGLFARDDGNANFDATTLGGGNCYALTFDSHDGRVRAGRVVEGAFTDFLAADPVHVTSTGWRLMRISTMGSSIRYYLDGSLIASVSDTAHTHGRCGVGHHEYFATNNNATGAFADNFEMSSLEFDGDGDGDVDVADVGPFVSCLVGPESEHPETSVCHTYDGDEDADTDLVDFQLMQKALAGSGP